MAYSSAVLERVNHYLHEQRIQNKQPALTVTITREPVTRRSAAGRTYRSITARLWCIMGFLGRNINAEYHLIVVFVQGRIPVTPASPDTCSQVGCVNPCAAWASILS